MNTFLGRNEAEAKVEDIILLYAADSIAAMEECMSSNICWSGTAVKAAYRLGRSLGDHFEDISFGVNFLDDALQKGRQEHVCIQTMTTNTSNVNVRHIASR